MMTGWDRAAWKIADIRRDLAPHTDRDHVRLARATLGVAEDLLALRCAYGPMTGDFEDVRVALELLLDAIHGCADRTPDDPEDNEERRSYTDKG